jgi:hypothetical protein
LRQARLEKYGWGVEVKNTLQITDETEQQWHEETTVETNTTFLGNHWHVSWQLRDLWTKTVSYDKLSIPEESHSQLTIITSLYDDGISDKDVQFPTSVMELIGRQK